MVDALKQFKMWSERNPGHFPLNINLDVKGAYRSGFRYVRGLWTINHKDTDRDVFLLMDKIIRSVFDKSNLMVPGDIMGSCSSLREGVQGNGWPNVCEVKGKVYFVLNIYGEIKKCAHWYPITSNSVMFKRSYDPNHPDSSMFETGDISSIEALADQGFMVGSLLPLQKPKEVAKDQNKFKELLDSRCAFVRTNHPTKLISGSGCNRSVIIRMNEADVQDVKVSFF